MISLYAPIFVFGFFLTIFSVLFALYLFPKIGLMDKPKKYGILRAPIPYYGGLTIYFPVLITILLFVPMTMELLGVLIASGLIFVVGFFDDYFSIKPVYRLLTQVIAALILVVFGISLLSFKLPFLGQINLDFWMIGNFNVLSSLFIVFWILIIVNAMNFIDGISGLNSGVTAISAFIIFILSIHPGIHSDPYSQTQVALLALVISSAAFAFLIFDFPKPSILMGDTGSTFFGFILAVLAIFSGGKIATAVLVLGIPLVDLIWVVFRRTFIERKKFWHGDLMHLHHRLMYFGFKDKHVVLLYLFISAVFGAFAVIFVSADQKFFILIAFMILMLLLSLMLVFARKLKNYEIRSLTKSDLVKYENGFVYLSNKVWSEIGAEPWDLDKFSEEYNSKWDFSLYVYSNDRIIACLIATKRDGQPYINKIAILPEYRSFGLGRDLVDSFISKIKKLSFNEVFLSCKRNNVNALSFYNKLDFKILREEDREGEKLYILNKKI